MSLTHVGPYTLLQRLGSGGMGEVWMAEWSGPAGASKRVALKLLRSEHLDKTKLREMFLSEARLAMLLNNSNIVQVFDVGEGAGGLCYMAMEWIDGLDLAQLCRHLWSRGDQVSPTLAAYIIGEVLKALACAHDFVHEGRARTIVHRDVTPHNVMLSIWGEVKLLDFGVARMASEETSGLHAKGKLRYMPPEQLSGAAREPTIDLFAVGAILHELLDGRGFREFAVDEARLIGMVVHGEVDELRDPEGIPAALLALRQGLLEAQVEDRIPTAREAHRALARWPGYRDAKFELEDLVRSLRAVEGPTPAPRPLPSSFDTTDGRSTPSAVVTHHTPLRSGPRVAARPAREGGGRPSIGGGRNLRAAAGLASVLGLLSGAAVVAQLVRQAPVKALELSSDSDPRPLQGRDPWQPWAPSTAPPEVPVEAKEKETPKPRHEARKRAGARRVGLTLQAPGFFFVELRVGQTLRTLDRINKDRARLKLAPGRHHLDYRKPGESWRSAGSFVVEAETPMIVTLRPDGSISTTR